MASFRGSYVSRSCCSSPQGEGGALLLIEVLGHLRAGCQGGVYVVGVPHCHHIGVLQQHAQSVVQALVACRQAQCGGQSQSVKTSTPMGNGWRRLRGLCRPCRAESLSLRPFITVCKGQESELKSTELHQQDMMKSKQSEARQV